MCALSLTRQRGIAPRGTGRILRSLWQHVMREQPVPHEHTGFHLLLIQQLGCTAWFRSTHWKRHTSCHPSTVNCVVTFRYREVSCHSSHSLLSQSKIVEPTRCTRPCSPTESPSTCSSAVKLYRTPPWLQARGAAIMPRVHTARHTLKLQAYAESLSHSRLKGHMIKEHNVVIRHTLTVQPSDAFVDQMRFVC